MATWLANSSNKSTWDQAGPGDNCPFGTSTSQTGFTCVKTSLDGASNTSTIPSSGTYPVTSAPATIPAAKTAPKAALTIPGATPARPIAALEARPPAPGTATVRARAAAAAKLARPTTVIGKQVGSRMLTALGAVVSPTAARSRHLHQRGQRPNKNSANHQRRHDLSILPGQDTYCPTASIGLNYDCRP